MITHSCKDASSPYTDLTVLSEKGSAITNRRLISWRERRFRGAARSGDVRQVAGRCTQGVYAGYVYGCIRGMYTVYRHKLPFTPFLHRFTVFSSFLAPFCTVDTVRCLCGKFKRTNGAVSVLPAPLVPTVTAPLLFIYFCAVGYTGELELVEVKAVNGA